MVPGPPLSLVEPPAHLELVAQGAAGGSAAEKPAHLFTLHHKYLPQVQEAYQEAERTLAALPQPVAGLKVIQALEEAGYSAWIIGGWVRDGLLGRPGHDVDVASSAPWQEAASLLRDRGLVVIPTGSAHGTITVLVDGMPVEVTTYRREGAYLDGRHPSQVSYVSSIEQDLARRDFTINAMAYHPNRGLLDLFGGLDDLALRRIRAVGDPQKRMEEDALRVLRAVRFAARYGFAIDPATQAAVNRGAQRLYLVSRERVGQEMRGIVASGRAGWALREQKDALFSAIPELGPMAGFPQQTPYHSYDVLDHVARVCDFTSVFCGGILSERLGWASLLHDIAKPECLTFDTRGQAHFYGHPAHGRDIARTVLRRLAIPKDVTIPALALIRLHDRPVKPQRASVLSILSDLDRYAPGQAPWLVHELMIIKRADAMAKAPAYRSYAIEVDGLESLAATLLAAGAPYRISDLSISGNDIIRELALTPGPSVGLLLQRLLKEVQSGFLPAEKSALLARLYSLNGCHN